MFAENNTSLILKKNIEWRVSAIYCTPEQGSYSAQHNVRKVLVELSLSRHTVESQVTIYLSGLILPKHTGSSRATLFLKFGIYKEQREMAGHEMNS